jgi:hypothetical protein
MIPYKPPLIVGAKNDSTGLMAQFTFLADLAEYPNRKLATAVWPGLFTFVATVLTLLLANAR